jgi:hypothetical protein
MLNVLKTIVSLAQDLIDELEGKQAPVEIETVSPEIEQPKSETSESQTPTEQNGI